MDLKKFSLDPDKLKERGKKTLIRVYTLLLILSIVIVLPLQVYKQISFDEEFYDEVYQENGVYDQYGYNKTWRLTTELWGYIEGNNDLESQEWSNRDTTHMQDVRQLIQYSFWIHTFFLVLTLILLAILFSVTRHYVTITRTAFITSGLVLLGLAGLFYVLKPLFPQAFIFFHQVFFDNNLWLMDPAQDSLIILYGGNFFYSIVVKIFQRVAIWAAGVFGIGLLLHLGLMWWDRSHPDKQ